MKKIQSLIFALLLFTLSTKSFAWGREGHSMVAQIAFNYLDATTKEKVIKYLNGMSIEDAASWMDDLRSDKEYDYLKPCHYINLEKDESYVHQVKDNIANELNKVINELRNPEKITNQKIGLTY